MKFTKMDFLRAPAHTIAVDASLQVEEHDLLHHSQVKSIPEMHVSGTLQFDGSTLVYSDLEVEGVMIVSDSITSKDLEVEYDTEMLTTYSFEPVDEDNEEIVTVQRETIDPLPELIQAVVYEAPMSISVLPRDQYPSGDGWQLLSDQDEAEPVTDPRWDMLKNLNFEDD